MLDLYYRVVVDISALNIFAIIDTFPCLLFFAQEIGKLVKEKFKEKLVKIL